MADRGRTIPHETLAALIRLVREGRGKRETARLLDIDIKTARKYLRKGIEVSPTYGK